MLKLFLVLYTLLAVISGYFPGYFPGGYGGYGGFPAIPHHDMVVGGYPGGYPGMFHHPVPFGGYGAYGTPLHYGAVSGGGTVHFTTKSTVNTKGNYVTPVVHASYANPFVTTVVASNDNTGTSRRQSG